MKYLITLLTALTLISCGTEAEIEDGFEPYQVGTWMVTSPETADWVGERVKWARQTTETDTVFVSSPENHNIEIVSKGYPHPDGSFEFVIIDSTINTNTFDSRIKVDLVFDEYNPNFTIHNSGKRIGADQYRYIFELGYIYDCRKSAEDPEYFNLVMQEREKDTPFRIYRFPMTGVKDTLEYLLC